MSPPGLSSSDAIRMHNSRRDVVASLLQCGPCDLNNVRAVVNHAGHVLNKDEPRTNYLSKARHPQVKKILGVRAPGVIIQIGVALTGRAANQEIEPGETALKAPLGRGDRSPERSIDELCDVIIARLIRREILSKHLKSCGVSVDRQCGRNTATNGFSGLLQSKTQATATREQIDRSQRSRRSKNCSSLLIRPGLEERYESIVARPGHERDPRLVPAPVSVYDGPGDKSTGDRVDLFGQRARRSRDGVSES